MKKHLFLSLAACTALSFTACEEKTQDDDETSSSSGEEEGGSSSTTGTTGTSSTTAGTSTTGDDTGTTGDFVPPMDMGGVAPECDLWTEDCSDPNDKCMPWDSTDTTWDSTKCVPVDPNAGQVGDPCTAEVGQTGVDTCIKHSMCWGTDANGENGTCIAMCTGTADAPICDAGSICVIRNEGVLILCLPSCDPLIQDCEEGQVCIYDEKGFLCVTDASGEEGQYGDPCAYANVCDPGLLCLDAASVPDCTAEGCCSELCDLSDASGDAQCMGQAGGQVCEAVYDPAATPPGYENVGYCTIPA